MSPRPAKFTHYMVAVGAARHAKFRRLTPAERQAFFMGVLSLAAQAPIRGCLLVGDVRADEVDVAGEADVPVRDARSALEKLRRVGVLYMDEELGCERVHDFEEHNPQPKKDTTNAERQARYRAKLKASRNAVSNGTSNAVSNGETDVSNAYEVEEEEKTPVTPPEGAGARVLRFDRKPVPDHRRQLAERILAEFNQQAGTNLQPYTDDGKPSEGLRRIIGALTSHQAVDFDQAAAAIRWQLARPYWGDATPHPGNVFGPKVIDTALESSNTSKPESSTAEFVARMNNRRPAPSSSGDAA